MQKLLKELYKEVAKLVGEVDPPDSVYGIYESLKVIERVANKYKIKL